ncbi:MAG: hypothetical protein LWW94_11710 [Candidatus Desulfofervidaceae bacterium]|nr:hypothetical protein [Candidatus Desulfofervidaceae bacterium]
MIHFASKYWSSASVAHFVLVVEIMISTLLLGMSGWLFIFRRSKFTPFLIGTGFILMATFIIYQFLPNPYEFTHLPEYGVLGFLLINAVSRSEKSPYLRAFFIQCL